MSASRRPVKMADSAWMLTTATIACALPCTRDQTARTRESRAREDRALTTLLVIPVRTSSPSHVPAPRASLGEFVGLVLRFVYAGCFDLSATRQTGTAWKSSN